MVAHRSPKPPVWVRILLPLPKNLILILYQVFLFILFLGGDFITKNLFKTFYLFLVLLIFICIFFIPVLSSGNYTYTPIDSEILDFNPNGFVWPIPRLY